MNSLRILGLLLDYPDDLLWESQSELLEIIGEATELTGGLYPPILPARSARRAVFLYGAV